jgi:hypothetical protein
MLSSGPDQKRRFECASGALLSFTCDTAGAVAGGARQDQGGRCGGTRPVAGILLDLHRPAPARANVAAHDAADVSEGS